MLAILKSLQSILQTLHSDGSPAQVAAGIALGSALGIMPLMNLQNLLVIAVLLLVNVSFGAGMLGWALATPIGFLLDPAFDALGRTLLEAPGLRGLWTSMANLPVVPYTNFNNSVTLGSLVVWLALVVPIYFGARYGVIRYRATLAERVKNSRWWRAAEATRLYDVYRWFRGQS